MTAKVTDIAGNASATSPATSVTVDTVAPTLSVDIADGSLSDGDASSVVAFTFSEAPVGFTAGDIDAVGGVVTGLSATGDPLVYTATFTADDGLTGTGSVTVAAGGYTDAALNLGGAGSDNVTIDTTNPTLAIDIADSSLSDGDASSVVTFTFSETPVGFTAADIDAVGGTVMGLSATGDPLVYTATFTADDGFSGTGSVSVAAGSYTDAALNLGGSGSDSVTIDRTNPTLAIDVADSSLSDGDASSVVTFTFSEAPVGFTAGDIDAVGGAVTGLSATGDPLVYTATFTADDGFSGTGSVTVAAGGYTDAAMNLGGAGSDSVAIDRTADLGGDLTLTITANLSLNGGAGDDRLDGGAGDDTLNGEDGDDVLVGGAGSDTLIGGADNDYLIGGITALRKTVTFTVSGIDSDVASANATVTFTDSASHTVTVAASSGIADLSTLIDGPVSSILNVADGVGNTASVAGMSINLDTDAADTMVGGGGDDLYYVDNTADQVVEAAGGGNDNVYTSVDYALGAGQEVEFLRVHGSAGLTLTGNELSDYLLGGAGNDTLNGGLGNDRLDGRGGTDAMTGGGGDDLYYVDSASDQVVEAGGEGADTILASADYILGAGQEVELLRVHGSAGLTLTGNELADRLIGGVGNDTLNGGLGNDRLDGRGGTDAMTGGGGDDLYYVDSASDQVVEAGGEGADTILASADYILGAGQEVELLRVHG